MCGVPVVIGARTIALVATAVLIAGCSSGVPAAQRESGQTVTTLDPAALRLDVQRTDIGTGTMAWAEVGSGEPLILLNGTASPMAEWDPAFLAALAARHRVLVLDYPGLGGSTRLPGRLTFDKLADAMVRWMAAIDLDRATVLGWSMGTFVAQRMAVRYPEAVARLILVGGNPGGDRTVLGPPWVQRADSDPNYTIETYLRTNYPHTRCAQRAGKAFLARQEAAVESGRYPPDRVPTRTYDAMVAAEDPWLRSNRNLRQLSQLDVPSLVMVGAGDVITPPANSRVLAGALEGSVDRDITGAGHSVLFQEPELSASLIGGFMVGGLDPGRTRVSGKCG